MYIVISDNLLRKFFPESYPDCKEKMKKGVALKDFSTIPCILNGNLSGSRIILDRYLSKTKTKLNVVAEMTQLGMHHQLSSRDLGMSFCFSMYLNSIFEINKLHRANNVDNMLNIFPINDLKETNKLKIFYNPNKILSSAERKFCKLVADICRSYSSTSFS